MVSLRLNLLGGIRVRDVADCEIAIAGTKAMLLLAYLALKPGKPRSRETLIGLLWSDRGDHQARGSLRQALWSLGQAFKSIKPSPLVIDGEMVSIDPTAFEIDVSKFERLVQEGTPAALQSAIQLYHGELLQGIRIRDPEFSDFLFSERARLHEMVVDGCKRLLDHQLQMDLADAAVATAKRLLEIDPLQEVAHRTLMQQYASKGQIGLAIKQYQICQDIFRRDLKVDPGVETKRLLDKIRFTDPSADGGCIASPDSTVREHRDDRGVSTSAPEKPSIAVLPFVNISGDPEQEYFSDGITEDIITALSKLRWFLVIARNSTFAYKGQAVDIRRIGRELDVGYVLQGSVRKAGNHVRVTVQLADTLSGAQHWAEKYDNEISDIFTLQDEITMSVTAAILPKLVAAESVRSQPARRRI